MSRLYHVPLTFPINHEKEKVGLTSCPSWAANAGCFNQCCCLPYNLNVAASCDLRFRWQLECSSSQVGGSEDCKVTEPVRKMFVSSNMHTQLLSPARGKALALATRLSGATTVAPHRTFAAGRATETRALLSSMYLQRSSALKGR